MYHVSGVYFLYKNRIEISHIYHALFVSLKSNTTHPVVYSVFGNAELFYGSLVVVNVDN